ncbi:IclR family transcriptional regulator C-terminal domain-containing protein [Nonomuraea sp. NPDC026600]|uniref:IclR family transcriptional regulator domain-containing protein n=1 Tax=Nonomuraea sp. NPDC026600 TaxID=3155363 RepID=UPI0033C8306C
MVSRPGRRLPSRATGLGKAILAGRPWEEVDALLPETLEARTVHTFTDRAAERGPQLLRPHGPPRPRPRGGDRGRPVPGSGADHPLIRRGRPCRPAP